MTRMSHAIVIKTKKSSEYINNLQQSQIKYVYYVITAYFLFRNLTLNAENYHYNINYCYKSDMFVL